MRRIIKNLSYDTNTARTCGEYSENHPGDYTYFREVLMLKKSGEFFLWAYGEHNTKYAKPTASGWIEQELIIPLSIDAARAWAEEHMDGADYEQLFGEVAEDEERDVLSIYMEHSMAQRVRQLAREQHKSISALIVEHLRDI